MARVRERQVDVADARLKDRDREQLDKGTQEVDGSGVAAEVGGDDQRRLGLQEGVADALDRCSTTLALDH